VRVPDLGDLRGPAVRNHEAVQYWAYHY
jgi:hypothetical protein